MNFWDTIGNIGSSVLDIGKAVAPVAGPITDFATGAYSLYETKKAEQEYADYLRERERINHQQSQQLYNAQQGALGAAQGPINAALDLQKAALAQQLELYKPFHDASVRLLPGVEQTYSDALKGLSLLYGTTSTPESLKRIADFPTSLDGTASGQAVRASGRVVK